MQGFGPSFPCVSSFHSTERVNEEPAVYQQGDISSGECQGSTCDIILLLMAHRVRGLLIPKQTTAQTAPMCVCVRVCDVNPTFHRIMWQRLITLLIQSWLATRRLSVCSSSSSTRAHTKTLSLTHTQFCPSICTSSSHCTVLHRSDLLVYGPTSALCFLWRTTEAAFR